MKFICYEVVIRLFLIKPLFDIRVVNARGFDPHLAYMLNTPIYYIIHDIINVD